MQYVKRLLILKELEKGYSINTNPISAICRLEFEDGVCSLYLTFVNIKALSNGEYFFYLLDSDERLYKFPLGVRPTTKKLILPSSPNLEKGFLACLTAQKTGVPLTIAFSSTENCHLTFYQLKSIIAESALKAIEEQPEFYEQPKPVQTEETKSTTQYDDEAVATVNYFENETQEAYGLEQNLSKENTVFNGDGYVQPEDGVFNFNSQTQAKENEENPLRHTIKTQSDFSKNYNEQNPFYEFERERIEKMLNSFPDYPNLKCYFPDSRFVKINYSPEKYYVVGVIKEQAKEKYICYGVPATYSPTPPRALDGYCVFIPLSLFDMKGEGFWMMFQDCTTGESVTPNKN